MSWRYGAALSSSSHSRNRYAEGHNRRCASSSFPGRPFRNTYFYGPGNANRPRNARCISYWRNRFPDTARRVEEEDKERERREEERRLKEEELERKKQLIVKNLDLHIDANSMEHHTNLFEGKETQLVLRRGREFCVTVTFSRTYCKDQDDLIFLLDADQENPGKNLKERFKLDEKDTDTYRQDEDFGARIIESDSQKKMLKIAVYIPGDCVVGEWDLKIKTRVKDEEENLIYKHPTPLIILFNPWSPADQVHFTEDETLLNEYILNDNGTRYWGSANSIGTASWTYGQFEEGILDICLDILLKAFGFKMTPDMADPVLVSRALSMIINEQDDDGVLVGNWSDDYSGGANPVTWDDSTDILRQYYEDKEPVKYGQCWVFSHVLTTVCRALGLPCRSVTNFDSAHDRDASCTIDKFVDVNGDRIPGMGDSVWNFHVWNEVWILRPDLPCLEDGSYSGWHVIDATPQERSFGKYQCGPCPVEAAKRGHVNIGYETDFVFSEVNAEEVHWCLTPDGELEVSGDVKKYLVGKNVSTKPPDGEGCVYGRRLDLTDNYKYPEGSQKEREAVRRAVRFSRHGKEIFDKIFNTSSVLEVSFNTDTQTMIGSDVVMKVFVKNISEEDREVDNLVSVRTCKYWNRPEDDKPLAKEKFPVKTIKAGKTESYSVTVPYKVYKKECDDMLNIFGYARATDIRTKMPYLSEASMRVRRPDLQVEGPKSALSGKPVAVKVSFTNPLPEPLTGCKIHAKGNLKLAEDDTNGFKYDEKKKLFILDYRNVKRGETVTLKLRVLGNVKPSEDGRIRNMNFSFLCKEIGVGLTGCFPLKISVSA